MMKQATVGLAASLPALTSLLDYLARIQEK